MAFILVTSAWKAEFDGTLWLGIIFAAALGGFWVVVTPEAARLGSLIVGLGAFVAAILTLFRGQPVFVIPLLVLVAVCIGIRIYAERHSPPPPV